MMAEVEEAVEPSPGVKTKETELAIVLPTAPSTSPSFDGTFSRYLRPNMVSPYDILWDEKQDRYIITDRGMKRVLSVHPNNGASVVLCANEDGQAKELRSAQVRSFSSVMMSYLWKESSDAMQPWGLAYIDATEELLFTDYNNKMVMRYKDQLCSPWGTDALKNAIETPTGITTFDQGHVLITDYTRKCVHVADADGVLKGSFGEEYLLRPRDIAVNLNRGLIYVVDESSYIHIFNGKGVIEKPIAVNADDKTWSCRGIAIDKYDNVVVTAREASYLAHYVLHNHDNEKIMMFDANGEPLDQIGSNVHSYWSEFNCVRGLCFDYKRNRMVVVNGKHRCLNVYKLYSVGDIQ